MAWYLRGLMKNYQELVVDEHIKKLLPHYPALANSPELQMDVACIALNDLKPRYSRRPSELERFMSQAERDSNNAAAHAAVLSAIQFVILNRPDLAAGDGPGRLDL
jgi:hypothetical protein